MIFDSATFQVQMQLFNAWVQMHEEQLDRNFVDFGGWQKLFDDWRNTAPLRANWAKSFPFLAGCC